MFRSVFFAGLCFASAAVYAGSCEQEMSATAIRQELNRVEQARLEVASQIFKPNEPGTLRLLLSVFDALSTWERRLNQELDGRTGLSLELPEKDRIILDQLLASAREAARPMPYGFRAREVMGFGDDWSLPLTSSETGGRDYFRPRR